MSEIDNLRRTIDSLEAKHKYVAAHCLLLLLRLRCTNQYSYHNCFVMQAFGRRRSVDTGNERAQTAREAAQKRS